MYISILADIQVLNFTFSNKVGWVKDNLDLHTSYNVIA